MSQTFKECEEGSGHCFDNSNALGCALDTICCWCRVTKKAVIEFRRKP